MPDKEAVPVAESVVPERDARPSDSQLRATGDHLSDADDEASTDLVPGPQARPIGAQSVLLRIDSAGGVGTSMNLRRFEHEDPLPPIGRGRERYEVMRTLGAGGMGHVYLVADRDLRRRVAMKVMKPEVRSHTQRFVEEAQILGQLDHPNIVPLHDLALASDGRPYCTMRYVQGRTLADVIAGLLAGDAEHTRVNTLTGLMQIYQQILQAMSYAHARGVIHRDVKPQNVMLGEHGEVQVVDWGLAKVLDPAMETSDEECSGNPSESSDRQTVEKKGRTSAGQVMGTWSHMSPEQATGRPVDEQTDIWALGVILYELLTLRQPFEGDNAETLRTALVGEQATAPRVRAPELNIPLELEAVCLRCLEKRPERRPQRVDEIHEAIQAWMEASADKTRRHELAEARAAEGRMKLAEYHRLKHEVKRLQADVEETASRFEGWQPIDEKGEVIVAQDRLRAARRALTKSATSVVGILGEALGFEDGNTTARELLADYYWDRYLEAEERLDPDAVDYYGDLVTQLHDGKYARELKGDGSLTLTSDPIGAEVWLYDLVEEGFIVVERNRRRLGSTPLPAMPLPIGSYLVVLEKEDYRDTRYPVYISRNRDWLGEVKLYRDEEIGEGFIYIPEGPFIEGGDRDANLDRPASGLSLPSFALARQPVTMAEYLEFLNDLAAREGIDAARARSPRNQVDAPLSSMLVEDGRGGLALPELDVDGDRWDPLWPALAMSFHDALAYCEWRSSRDGVSYRLPTEHEWEKAARGVDGRWYPWGWRFDSSLCNMVQSRRLGVSPVSVEEFPQDISIYGIRGLAGNISEWTSSPRVFGTNQRFTRVAKGGTWADPGWKCRAASAFGSQPDNCVPGRGLRLARSLP